MNRWRMIGTTVCVAISVSTVCAAQDSSLLRRELANDPQAPLTIDRVGLTFVPAPPPPRELKLHDHIKVRVTLKSRVTSEGEMQRRKTASLDAVLNDFPVLDGLRFIKPSPQSDGDPRAKGQINQQFRALGE